MKIIYGGQEQSLGALSIAEQAHEIVSYARAEGGDELVCAILCTCMTDILVAPPGLALGLATINEYSAAMVRHVCEQEEPALLN